MKQRTRKAVSPVLATLLMVAVAVAMSVIIFTWSQGFPSQTGEATGGQQAAQNVAAQSGIAIEAATFNLSSGVNATLYVRNVGSVAVTIGNAIATGPSTNSFQGSKNLKLSLPPH
jgi:flagellin-like protein